MTTQQKIQLALFALSIFAMSTLIGWPLAILLVLMIYFHEVGHQSAARFFGCKTGPIFMLPFLGGIALIDDKLSRFEHAIVSLWGPVHGLIFCLAAFAAFSFTGNPVFLTAMKFSAFINLFNLLPLGPLDGGQVLKSIAFSMHEHIGRVTMWLGIALSVFLAVKVGGAVMIAIAVLSLLDAGGEKVRTFRAEKMKWTEIGFILIFWGLLFLALCFILA